MKKTAVVYWSGTGNTEAMAKAVAEGMESAGAQVTMLTPDQVKASELSAYDAIAFGCPAMGSEELEYDEFQPMWDEVKETLGDKKVVLFGSYSWAEGEWMDNWKADADEAFEAKWARIMAIRDDVKKVLEQARADKTIGSALEAGLTLYCSKEVYDFLNAIPMDELADLMIVSHVELVKGEGGAASAVEGLGVAAAHATGDKCERCWKYEPSVGEDGLCPRCAKVLKQ